MIALELQVKLDRAEHMSDASTLRACGLWNFYQANRAEFDKIANLIYARLCNTLRQAAQINGAGNVPPPTLAECQDFCEKIIDRFPIYGRLRIKSSLNPSEQQECYTALARYLIENSWDSIVSQNPCIE